LQLPKLADIEMVAKRLGVGEQYVRRMVAGQQIKFVKIGHYVRIDLEVVREWVEDRRRRPGEQSGESDGPMTERRLIVVDASVVAPALADDDADGDRARERLRGERLLAPELLDVAVIAVVRKALLAGVLDERRAAMALADLVDLDLERVRHRPLLGRIWELHRNVTPYDAAYVALAESIEATLVTADRRLSRAPGPRCQIEYLG